MFKQIRILILLSILLFVALSAWLSQARSTDWNDTLWVAIYPINAEGDRATQRYIDTLKPRDFESIERFMLRETKRYGAPIAQPVHIELSQQVDIQPPALPNRANVFDVVIWSLRARLWASRASKDKDDLTPDVRLFIRYHQPREFRVLDESVGMKKGMFGIVNAFAGRTHTARNNVVIAHEFLHTIGATDKYDPGTNQPLNPIGLAEPNRRPVFPQRYAEIMGGRIALSPTEAVMPTSLNETVIGTGTALEIRLTRD